MKKQVEYSDAFKSAVDTVNAIAKEEGIAFGMAFFQTQDVTGNGKRSFNGTVTNLPDDFALAQLFREAFEETAAEAIAEELSKIEENVGV